MDLLKAIKERRSVRSFKNKKVDKRLIDEVIDAANYAPSACNFRLWKFVVIDNVALKKRIVDMGGAIFIKDAPVVIMVLYDNRTNNIEYQDYIQSGSAAIQNMLLRAHSLGLGSCWVCQLPPKAQLRKLLKIPAVYEPIACIVMGYADKEVKLRERKNKIGDIISYNKFDFRVERRQGNKANTVLRIVYMGLPLFFRRLLRPFVERRFVRKFDNRK